MKIQFLLVAQKQINETYHKKLVAYRKVYDTKYKVLSSILYFYAANNFNISDTNC